MECKEKELGIVNPSKIFNCLNNIQKEDCPEAYEPEMVIQYKRREEELKRKQEYEDEVDKTLFDFDDEIDNLNDVEDRYKFYPMVNSEPPIEDAKSKEFILD